MKYTFLLALLVASASATTIEQKSAHKYTYEDIREQELKCKADRNREWKYDAATNTWTCPLQRYDWASRESAQNWLARSLSGMINFITHPRASMGRSCEAWRAHSSAYRRYCILTNPVYHEYCRTRQNQPHRLPLTASQWSSTDGNVFKINNILVTQ